VFGYGCDCGIMVEAFETRVKAGLGLDTIPSLTTRSRDSCCTRGCLGIGAMIEMGALGTACSNLIISKSCPSTGNPIVSRPSTGMRIDCAPVVCGEIGV
jgi:hypothetical protein